MNTPSLVTTAIATAAGLLGGVLAVYGIVRAARPRLPADGLAWMVLANGGYVLLGLAAAVRAPQGDGLRGAVFQGGVALLSAALGALSLSGARDVKPRSGRSLASVALFVAWLGLLGLPPTAGFHARVLVYRSLLQNGWHGSLIFALAISVAGLIPAFSALALGCPGSLRGGRAFLAILLLAALLVIGLYPGFGLALGDFVARGGRLH